VTYCSADDALTALASSEAVLASEDVLIRQLSPDDDDDDDDDDDNADMEEAEEDIDLAAVISQVLYALMLLIVSIKTCKL